MALSFTAMPRSSVTCMMSTRRLGRAIRIDSSGTSVCPPAMMLASPPSAAKA
jgi:hypothetical protein